MNQFFIGDRSYTFKNTIAQELATDKNAAYLCTLDYLQCVSVIGDNARLFLQGQLSCDVGDVSQNRYQTGIYCSLKGRIIALLDVIFCYDYQLVIEKDITDKTLSSLKTAAMLSKVTLKKASQYQVLGIIGAPDQLELPVPIPEQNNQVCQNEQACLYRINESMCILLVKDSLAETLIANNQQYHRGSLLWHYHCLLNHRPAIYPQTQGVFLPHRLELHRQPGIINLEKGCFRGQEIIARTHYRAKLKHHFATYTNSEQPALAQKIFNAQNTEIGEVIDWCPTSENTFLVAGSLKNESS